MGLVSLLLVVCVRQEAVEVQLERLKDDRIEVRAAAALRLIELFPDHDAAIRRRAAAAEDPEVRGMLARVIRRGERAVDRRTCAAALTPRLVASYPELGEDLFGDDLERRARALRALAQIGYAANPERRGFFMTPAEARSAVPPLSDLLRGGEELEPVRLAWIDLIAERPVLLADPRVAAATGALFDDPSESSRSRPPCGRS